MVVFLFFNDKWNGCFVGIAFIIFYNYTLLSFLGFVFYLIIRPLFLLYVWRFRAVNFAGSISCCLESCSTYWVCHFIYFSNVIYFTNMLIKGCKIQSKIYWNSATTIYMSTIRFIHLEFIIELATVFYVQLGEILNQNWSSNRSS